MGKQQIMIYLCLFISFLAYGVQQIVSAKEKNNISQIVDIYQQQNIQIEKWSIYAKELVHGADEDLFEESMEKVLNNFPHASWEVERSGLEKQMIISLDSENEEKIVFTLTEEGDLYTIYEINGNNWEEEAWSDTESSINKRMTVIFQQTPQIFSCVQGIADGIIKDGMLKWEEELLNEFHATPVESAKEGTFVSISAYTEQWNNALPTEKSNVNIQIALREEQQENQTRITIGTPIITTEY